MQRVLRSSTTKIRLMFSLKGWIRVMAPTWSRIKLCKVVLAVYALTRKILIKFNHKGSVQTCDQVQPPLQVKLADSFQISSLNVSQARYTTRTSLIMFHIHTNNLLPWWIILCRGTQAVKHWDNFLQLHLQTSIRTKLAKASTATWVSLVLIVIQTPWFNKSKLFFKDHQLEDLACHERKLDPSLPLETSCKYIF